MKLTSLLSSSGFAALFVATVAHAAPAQDIDLHPRTWDQKNQGDWHKQVDKWSQKVSGWKKQKDHHSGGGKDKNVWFDAALSTRAIPGNVTFGPPGPAAAFGHFALRVSYEHKKICADIRLVNVTGEYAHDRPGSTGVRLAEGAAGSQEERSYVFFKNPTFVRKDSTGAEVRESSSCVYDLGGLDLKRLVAEPSRFFVDVVTLQNPRGAIRGQLLPSEVEVKEPSSFTSIIRTEATANQVINANNASVPGLQGARASYRLRLNVPENILCYDIEATGYDPSSAGEYFSPAKTATHSHQAPFGANGPPRLAYKNPQPVGNSGVRRSSACVKGPFTTGLLSPAGVDTGSASGFTLQTLEDNPTAFFSDFHTEKFAAGAVRGNNYRAEN